MPSKRYAFLFPAATLLLALAGQSVLALSITGARRGSSADQPFSLRGGEIRFQVEIETDNVRRTRRNELDELLQFLGDLTFSQRYEFRPGRRLSGTFNIRNNAPCVPRVICFDVRGGVGAFSAFTRSCFA